MRHVVPSISKSTSISGAPPAYGTKRFELCGAWSDAASNKRQLHRLEDRRLAELVRAGQDIEPAAQAFERDGGAEAADLLQANGFDFHDLTFMTGLRLALPRQGEQPAQRARRDCRILTAPLGCLFEASRNVGEAGRAQRLEIGGVSEDADAGHVMREMKQLRRHAAQPLLDARQLRHRHGAGKLQRQQCARRGAAKPRDLRFDGLQRSFAVDLHFAAQPCEVCRRHALDLGHGGAVDTHDQRIARIVVAKTVGLGRAGVPDAIGDTRRAMPVAERQIAEPGRLHPRRIDRHVGFAGTAKSLHRPVRQSDAQRAGRRRNAVHPRRRIAAGPLGRQRRRQQHDPRRHFRRTRCKVQAHVGRQLAG